MFVDLDVRLGVSVRWKTQKHGARPKQDVRCCMWRVNTKCRPAYSPTAIIGVGRGLVEGF